MASRAKHRQMMAARIGGPQADMQVSMARVALENISKAEISCGFRSIMNDKDAAFQRGVTARREILDMIDRNAALKERMNEVYETGRKEGFKQAGWPIIKSCIAATCLMLQEKFGMGDDDIVRGVATLHDKITWALNYSELTDEVLEKTGIELRLDDPLEPVRGK